MKTGFNRKIRFFPNFGKGIGRGNGNSPRYGDFKGARRELRVRPSSRGRERLLFQENETGSQARQAIGNRFRFYNEQRPNTAFDCRRPMEVYQKSQPAAKAA
jgi:hypothetical protein